jgi:hypothetical protein
VNAPARTSTAAVVSLVTGIVSWVVLPVLAAIVAIVAGHMARGEIRREGLEGDALAVIGLVLGYLNLLLTLLLVGALIAGLLGLGVFTAFLGAG